MAITFTIVDHRVLPGVQIVQIEMDGKLVGGIYPGNNEIKIVSAHLAGGEGAFVVDKDSLLSVVFRDGQGSVFPIPHATITFEHPVSYVIVDGEIKKAN
jgi:hypothetical protein